MNVWQRRPYLWGGLRGLAVGIVALAAAAGVGFALLSAYPVDDGRPCDSDLACLPDLTGVVYTLYSLPFVIGLVGPLAAWLLGAPRWALYALPAASAVALACVAGGPADQAGGLPVLLGIHLATYVAIGLYEARFGARAAAGGPPWQPRSPAG